MDKGKKKLFKSLSQRFSGIIASVSQVSLEIAISLREKEASTPPSRS